jgi:hypothetical protein
MENHKKAFVLYKSWIDPIMELKDNDAGELLFSILKYVNGEAPEPNERILDLFNQIIAQIEYEWSKYNPVTKRFHWNYKGGITPENKAIRNSKKMSYWRCDVFARDKFTCQKCFKIGGELNAHHIKYFSEYPELRFDVNNGITLCKSCHIEIHKKSS